MEIDQATWAPGLWITDTGAAVQGDPPVTEAVSVSNSVSANQDAEAEELASFQPPPIENWGEAVGTGAWNADSDPWASEFWPCGVTTMEATDCNAGWGGVWNPLYPLDCTDHQDHEGGDGWSEAAAAAGLLPGADWPDLWLCDDGVEWLDSSLAGDSWSPEEWEAFQNENWNCSRRNGKRLVGANGNLMSRSRSHSSVPRRVDLQSQFKQHRESGQEVTTMMIRNVPNRYSRQNLMEELDDAGFESKYDFVYIPVDNATKWNVGYAFVNFEESSDCNKCMQAFDGREFKREARPKTNSEMRRKRLAQVAIAHLQGLQANLEHIMGKSIFFSANSSMRPWAKPSAIAKLPGHLHAALIGEAGFMAESPYPDMSQEEFAKAGGNDDDDATDRKQQSVISRVDAIKKVAIEDSHEVNYVNDFPKCAKTLEGVSLPPGLAHELSDDQNGVSQEWPWAEARCHGRGRAIGRSEVCGVRVSVAVWGARRPRLLEDGRRWPDRPHPAGKRSEVLAALPAPLVEERSADVDNAVHDYIPIHGTGFSAYSGEAGVKAFSEAWSAAVAKMKPSSQASSSSSRQRRALDPPARVARASDSTGEHARSQSRDHRLDEDFNANDPREAAAYLAKRRAPSMPALRSRAPHANRNTWNAEAQPADTSLLAVPRRRRQSQPPRRRGQILRQHALQDLDWDNKYGLSEATWESSDPPVEENTTAVHQERTVPIVTQSAMPLSEHDIRLCYMCPDTSISRFEGRWPMSSANAASMTTGCLGSTTPADGKAKDGWQTDGEVTSIVVQNLPSDFGQETLLAELRFLGLSGSFNFLYLPMDLATSMNIGSAFLNFRSAEETEHARSLLEGHVWQHFSEIADEQNNRPKATVDTAVIQGLEDNVMHYCLLAENAQSTDNAAPLVFPSPGIVMTASWELLDPSSECALAHWDSTNGLREHCVMSEKLSAFNPWAEMLGAAPGLVPMQEAQLNVGGHETEDAYQGTFDAILNSNVDHDWCRKEGEWAAPGHWGIDDQASVIADQEVHQEARRHVTEVNATAIDCLVADSTTASSLLSSGSDGHQSTQTGAEEKQSRTDSPEPPPLGLEWPTLSPKPAIASRKATASKVPAAKRRVGIAKSSATRASKASPK